jgi:hypothetical protein
MPDDRDQADDALLATIAASQPDRRALARLLLRAADVGREVEVKWDAILHSYTQPARPASTQEVRRTGGR